MCAYMHKRVMRLDSFSVIRLYVEWLLGFHNCVRSKWRRICLVSMHGKLYFLMQLKLNLNSGTLVFFNYTLFDLISSHHSGKMIEILKALACTCLSC